MNLRVFILGCLVADAPLKALQSLYLGPIHGRFESAQKIALRIAPPCLVEH
jgi:hypothetical protein